MAKVYRAWEADKRERRQRNLDQAHRERDDGWTIHTEHHWSRMLLDHRLDFWPSSNKFRWKAVNRSGNLTAVMNFIHNREQNLIDQIEPIG